MVKLYQAKKKTIQENRLKAKEARMKEREAKELLLVSHTVVHTEVVLQTCGYVKH